MTSLGAHEAGIPSICYQNKEKKKVRLRRRTEEEQKTAVPKTYDEAYESGIEMTL